MNATSRPTPPDFPPKKMGPKSKKKKKKKDGEEEGISSARVGPHTQ